MRRFSFVEKNRASAGFVLVALTVAAAFPLSASGADRVVLSEEFSSTG